MASEPDETTGEEGVRAADCPRRFTILLDGGVKATYACGAEVVDQQENAVDVDLLAERFPRNHRHGHLPNLLGWRG